MILILINDCDLTLSNIKQHQATLRNRNIRISGKLLRFLVGAKDVPVPERTIVMSIHRYTMIF
jgi:hypothetical protein